MMQQYMKELEQVSIDLLSSRGLFRHIIDALTYWSFQLLSLSFDRFIENRFNKFNFMPYNLLINFYDAVVGISCQTDCE